MSSNLEFQKLEQAVSRTTQEESKCRTLKYHENDMKAPDLESQTGRSSSPGTSIFSGYSQKGPLSEISDPDPSEGDWKSEDRRAMTPNLEFACPFHKHDPELHLNPWYRSCEFSRWQSIERLKEHIYRRHRSSHCCQRCKVTFDTEAFLESHLGQSQACSLQTKINKYSMTPETEKLLKMRKRDLGDPSEAGQWKKIYSVIFPDEPIPWPYYEPIKSGYGLNANDRMQFDTSYRKKPAIPVRYRLEPSSQEQRQDSENTWSLGLHGIVEDRFAGLSFDYDPFVDHEATYNKIKESNILQGVGGGFMDNYRTQSSAGDDPLEAKNHATEEKGIGKKTDAAHAASQQPHVLMSTGLESNRLALLGDSQPGSTSTTSQSSQGRTSRDGTPEKKTDIRSIIEASKKALVIYLKEEILCYIDAGWIAKYDSGPQDGPGDCPSSSSKRQAAPPSTHKPSNKRQKKNETSNDEPGGDSNDGFPERPNADCDPPDAVDEDIKWACHFRKKCPEIYCLPYYRTCQYSSFPTIARVKEHIYRVHKISEWHCLRCYTFFENQDLLKSHSQQKPSRCEVIEDVGYDHTAKTYKKLKSKKNAKVNETNLEKWLRMYHDLFPGDKVNVPSPYFEDERDIRIGKLQDRIYLDDQCFRGFAHYFNSRLQSTIESKLAHAILQVFPNGMGNFAAECFNDLAAKYSQSSMADDTPKASDNPLPNPGRALTAHQQPLEDYVYVPPHPPSNIDSALTAPSSRPGSSNTPDRMVITTDHLSFSHMATSSEPLDSGFNNSPCIYCGNDLCTANGLRECLPVANSGFGIPLSDPQFGQDFPDWIETELNLSGDGYDELSAILHL